MKKVTYTLHFSSMYSMFLFACLIVVESFISFLCIWGWCAVRGARVEGSVNGSGVRVSNCEVLYGLG